MRLLLPEPVQPLAETAAVTDDALDAALAAAVSKAQQSGEQDIPQPQRPVIIESNDLDYEDDPLAQPVRPGPKGPGM